MQQCHFLSLHILQSRSYSGSSHFPFEVHWVHCVMLLHFLICHLYLFYRLQWKTSSLVPLPVSHTHTSSRLPLSAEPLKTRLYACAPAQGAIYRGHYSHLWVIVLQESLGLEHTQRKGRGGGVFRWWGDTALCLCECVQVQGVTLPCGLHAPVLPVPMSYKTALIDLRKWMNGWKHVLPPQLTVM